jgi:acyl-CoA dehydrogenase
LFGSNREGLTGEQKLMVSTVNQIMHKFGEDYWKDIDIARKYPDDFVAEFESAGLTALPVPVEYGGAGLGIREASLVLEEINAAGGNCQPFHGQYYLSFMISRFASSKLKEQYLPPIAKGKLRMQTFALTESEAGSELARIKTFAEKKDGEYLVKGNKIYISRIEHSDLMVLAARTTPYDSVEKKTDGISLFLVPLKDANGLRVQKISTMFNSQTYEVFLDDLKIPEENRIGDEGKGFRILLNVLNPERILLASECIGDARWFINKSVEYAKDRIVFGRPIGSNQGVQFPIADVYARLLAVDKVRWHAAELYDEGADEKTVGEYANISKYLAAECSWQAANTAMDVFGGNGVSVDYHIERKFRETRLYKVAPISQNLVLAYIGHNILGLPRSY